MFTIIEAITCSCSLRASKIARTPFCGPLDGANARAVFCSQSITGFSVIVQETGSVCVCVCVCVYPHGLSTEELKLKIKWRLIRCM